MFGIGKDRVGIGSAVEHTVIKALLPLVIERWLRRSPSRDPSVLSYASVTMFGDVLITLGRSLNLTRMG